MAEHFLAAERLHFAWDNSLPPVLEIDPGDEVTIETWDASRHGTCGRGMAGAAVRLSAPPTRIPGPYHGCMAHAPDLMEASQRATRYLIDWLSATTHLSADQAYVLASVAAELRISQIVDAPDWTVTAFFPLSVLE